MDDMGVHFCIKCNTAFIGLGTYVTHRRNGCKGKKTPQKEEIPPSDVDRHSNTLRSSIKRSRGKLHVEAKIGKELEKSADDIAVIYEDGDHQSPDQSRDFNATSGGDILLYSDNSSENIQDTSQEHPVSNVSNEGSHHQNLQQALWTDLEIVSEPVRELDDDFTEPSTAEGSGKAGKKRGGSVDPDFSPRRTVKRSAKRPAKVPTRVAKEATRLPEKQPNPVKRRKSGTTVMSSPNACFEEVIIKSEVSEVEVCQSPTNCEEGNQPKTETKRRRGSYRPFCDCCNEQWPSHADLMVHKSIRPGSKIKNCDVCKVTFLDNCQLRAHFETGEHQMNMSSVEIGRLVHIQTSPGRLIKEKDSDTVYKPSPLQAYTTPPRKNVLLIKDEKGQTSTTPPKNVSLIKEEKAPSPESYPCLMVGCYFIGSNTRELHAHFRSEHRDGARFQCSLCNYSTLDAHCFARHLSGFRHKRLSTRCAVVQGESRNAGLNRPRDSDTDSGKVPCAEQVSEPNLHDANSCESTSTVDNMGTDESSMDTTGSIDHINHTIKIENNGHISGDTGGKFECPVCSLCLADNVSLVRHGMKHMIFRERQLIMQEGSGSELNTIASKHQDFVRNLSSDPNVYVTCPDCSQSMKRSAIIEHLRVHANIRPFKCLFCSFSATKGSALYTHVATTHLPKQNKSKLMCSYCCKLFSLKSALIDHLFKKHQDESKVQAQYSCDVCGKAFATHTNLHTHKRTHMEHLRRFKCTYSGCQGIFKTRQGLKTHYMIHVNDKPFSCDICGYRAVAQSAIKKHMLTHGRAKEEKPLKCDQCSYNTDKEILLHKHKQAHAWKKVHTCPGCDYKTNEISNLRRHLSQSDHRDLKLFKCCECDTGFSRLCEVIAHLKSVHGCTKSRLEIRRLTAVYEKEQPDPVSDTSTHEEPVEMGQSIVL